MKKLEFSTAEACLARAKDQICKTSGKVLIGLSHVPGMEKYTRELVCILRANGHEKLALELPEDFRKPGIEVAFFSPIAEYAEARGFLIVPLDMPISDNDIQIRKRGIFHALDAMLTTGCNKKNAIAKLEAELKRIRENLEFVCLKKDDVYSPPQYTYEYNSYCRTEASLLIAVNLVRTAEIEEIKFAARTMVEIVNKKMLDKIQVETPDLVIIGDGHAVSIAPQLNSYQYFRFVDPASTYI